MTAATPRLFLMIVLWFVTGAQARSEIFHQLIVQSGDVVPETDGARITELLDGRTNERGDLVYRARINRIHNGEPVTGLWKKERFGEHVKIALAGEPTSPYWIWAVERKATFHSFGIPAIDDEGQVAFKAMIDTPRNGRRPSLWLTATHGHHWLMASDISTAPVGWDNEGNPNIRDPQGTLTYFDQLSDPVLHPGGTVLFLGTVKLGSYDQRQGIWSFPRPTTDWFEPRKRETVHLLSLGSQTIASTRVETERLSRPSTSKAFAATLLGETEGSQTLSRRLLPAVERESEILARSGDIAPGAPFEERFARLGQAALDEQGNPVFWGSLQPSSQSQADESLTEGLWQKRGGRIVARYLTGDVAANTEGGLFTHFSSPSVDPAGHLTFKAIHRKDERSIEALWVEDPAQGLKALATIGNPAPGFPGFRFRKFGDPSLNLHGDVAFSALLEADSAPGIPTRPGSWIGNAGTGLECFIHEGRTLPTRGGASRTINGFRTGTFRSSGQLLLQTSFTDGVSAFFFAGLEDQTPPSTPAGLSARALARDRIRIEWNPATDNQAVNAYRVFRNGALRSVVQGTSFTDTGLSPGQSYQYRIQAVDFRDNLSLPGESISVAPPQAGPALVIDDDDDAFDGKVYWARESSSDSEGGSAVVVPVGQRASWNPIFPASGEYEVHVRVPVTDPNGNRIARDREALYTVAHAQGEADVRLDQNHSGGDWHYLGTWSFSEGANGEGIALFNQINQVERTMADAVRFTLLLTDENAPSRPTGFEASWLATNRVALSWDASSDDQGGIRYRILRDGDLVAITSATRYEDTGVAPGNTHSYTIEAVDFQNNASGLSRQVSVTLPRAGLTKIVDDSDPEFEGSRFWKQTGHADAFGGRSWEVGLERSAHWNPQLPVRARYELYAWVSARKPDGAATALDEEADYTIHTANGPVTQTVNQDRNPGGWDWLGTYLFDPAVRTGVSLLRDRNQFRPTIADAMKWVLVLTDDHPPGIPRSVHATMKSSFAIEIEWEASTDDLGVQYYQVRRNGELVAETAETAFLDRSVPPGSESTYTVEAVDFQGRVSGLSGATPSIVTPPPVTEFVVDNSDTGFEGQGHWPQPAEADAYGSNAAFVANGQTATWTANLPTGGLYEVHIWVPGRDATGQTVQRDPDADYTLHHAGGTTRLSLDQNEQAGRWRWIGTHEFKRGAHSLALLRDENQYARTVADAAKWVLLATDREAPTRPTGLEGQWAAGDRIDLHWTPSTDNQDRIDYLIFRDGLLVGTTDQTFYHDTDLLSGRRFRYAVQAQDFHRNASLPTETLSIATPEQGPEIIVDDGDPDYEGSTYWKLSGDIDAWDGDSRLLDLDATATWNPPLPATGLYELHAWVSARDPSGEAGLRDAEADYTINHAEGTTTLVVDQGKEPGAWQWLGTFPFAKGQQGSVSLHRDVNQYRQTVADGMRWVLLLTDETPPQPTPEVEASWTSTTSILVQWEEAVDDLGIARYELRRNGEPLATLTENIYLDTTVSPGSGYAASR
ncbi:MAG: hypothetical protein AAF514_03690 [Verrucomicrobiota bacterium]